MFRKILWNRSPARTTLLLSLVGCLVVGMSQSLTAQDNSRTKVAFLVGVAKYEKDGLSDLDYSEEDVTALKKALEKQNFTVTMLLGSGSGSERASLENIKVQWREFLITLKALKKNDLVLVAVAGHGVQLNVPDPVAMKTVDDEFYCPVDGQKDDAKSLWSLSKLIDELGEESGSSNNLFLMDACRFASGRGRGLDAGSVNLKNKCGILLACETGKKAHEYHDLRHGLFTYYVLEALHGKAKNADNVVTWDSLATYVKSEVIKASRLRKLPQTPNKMENLPGESPILADSFQAEIINGRNFNAQADPRAHGDLPFSGVTFTGTFDRTDFSNAKFENCKFDKCKFINSVNVYGARMINCQLVDCNFRGANTDTLTMVGTDPGGATYANGREPREE